MKVSVLISGQESLCSRTIKFRDVIPDDHSLITSLIEEVGERRGPLWEKLKFPSQVLSKPDPLWSNMSVLIDGRTYMVLANGSVLQPFQRCQKFSPQMELEF